MNVSHPYTAISPSLDSEVLAVLAGTTRPLTGREITRLTGRTSHSGVLDVLQRLTEHGLVNREEAGRAFLFTLNREHLAAPAVNVMASMGAELLYRIMRTVDEWRLAPVHVSLFGSAARRDGDTSSDIDLFIVRPESVSGDDPAWQLQLTDLESRIARWTGNRASIAEVAEADIVRLRTDEPPIITELRSEAIVLSGSGILDLLGTA